MGWGWTSDAIQFTLRGGPRRADPCSNRTFFAGSISSCAGSFSDLAIYICIDCSQHVPPVARGARGLRGTRFVDYEALRFALDCRLLDSPLCLALRRDEACSQYGDRCLAPFRPGANLAGGRSRLGRTADNARYSRRIGLRYPSRSGGAGRRRAPPDGAIRLRLTPRLHPPSKSAGDRFPRRIRRSAVRRRSRAWRGCSRVP